MIEDVPRIFEAVFQCTLEVRICIRDSCMIESLAEFFTFGSVQCVGPFLFWWIILRLKLCLVRFFIFNVLHCSFHGSALIVCLHR